MAAPQSAMLQLEKNPITLKSFLPPLVTCPRAWQRVPVVPFASHGRRRKIWKRVAASPVVVDNSYRRALAELQSQGFCSRKRTRREGHVPVWGDAQWDSRAEEPRDGEKDLAVARAAVSTAQEATRSTEDANGPSRHATFPEDALRWVPRKRHNTRWPIEPKTTAARMVAALQPLIEFDVPAAAQPEDTTHRMDAEKLEKRSTRRLSRRISLFPANMSPRKVSLITLTPAKISQSAISPVKRSPAVPSPVRVAESPLRSFTVNATPVKVVLESPKASPPLASPGKFSPPPPTPRSALTVKGASRPISKKRISDQVPLLFDQPTPDASAEPQYEAQRRRSLHVARRCDRRLSGPVRLFSSDSAKEISDRRHSSAPVAASPIDATARRRTLDAFFSAAEEAHELLPLETDSSPAREAAVEDPSQKLNGHGTPCAVFKIDAGTNLDIFGQWQKLAADARSRSPVKLAHVGLENSGSAVPVVSEANDAVIASPVQNVLGVTYVASDDESALGQAAMDSSPDAVEAEVHNSDSESASDEDSPALDQEDDLEFEHRDPEGLSTIYEESLVMETDADAAARHVSSLVGEGDSPTVSPAQKAVGMSSQSNSSSPAPAPSRDTAQVDGSPQLMHTDCEADSRALADHAAQMASNERPADEVSTNHVVTDVDVLFKPDSPNPVHEFTPEPSNLLGSETMDDANSPSTTEESVATPENDFCTTPLDIQTKKHDQQTAEMGSSISTESCQGDTLDENSTSDLTQTPLGTFRYGVPKQPSTPSQDVTTPTEADRGDATMENDGGRESSGFTPINGRQISPPSLTIGAEDSDSEAEPGDVEEDAMLEDEITEAIDDEDFTLTVVAPHLENDTLAMQRSHDDSETEMLRKFVTRVAADKNAKAAAAAAALAKKPARPKRRSGSTGSTASSTGSPIAKSDTPHKRTPLGEKNANSPSPVKKRKHGDDLEKSERDVLEVCDRPADAPKPKRRRKRGDPVLESASDAPETSTDSPASTEGGPRRSTRSRSSRVPLKPVAPSANSIALSLIPVKLAGMGMMDDTTMDMQLIMAKSRSEEKDVAAVTRVNTRKNKANAVHPKLVLARQAEDPAGWRMRELKMVFDAKESRSAEANADSAADGRKSRKAKGVRWAEELVRYQGDEAPSAFKAMASSLLADIMDEEEDELAVTLPARTPAPVQPEPVERLPSTPAKKALPRRTRSSRLLAPKPVDKIAEKPAVSPAPAVQSIPLPKVAAPVVAAPTPVASGTKAAMGTRRSKIAKLGMGVNGTPAPKRRGRAAI
ncbi:hypothetical protein QBC34DRAFT_412339 [Podospora aff. communis PSN243]|uniref:Uncharacterized protein n=1 Tax=Podospora aff. communis PSN243 TaxID=3040156 RepID=A0AAV9GBM9_9PEZI|nr:hypothetical protein QBC34DRAFT_412339 [Podospora aff. communis PSN243]